MGRRKIEIKFIEDRASRQATFSRRQAGLFKKADTLAKHCDVEIGILVNSPTNVPHVYGSPSFDDVVKRIQDPSASYILRSQAKLDELMKELKKTEEYEEVLRKRKEENIEKFNMKKLIDLSFGDLVAFKGKLEAAQADMKKKHVEMEPSSSALMLSKNKKKNKKKEKIWNEELVSSGQSDLSERKIYDLRPRNPVNYEESP